MSTPRYEDIVDSPLKPVLTRPFKPVNELLKELIIRENPKSTNLNWDHLGYKVISSYEYGLYRSEAEVGIPIDNPNPIEAKFIESFDKFSKGGIDYSTHESEKEALKNSAKRTDSEYYKVKVKVGILPEHQGSYLNPNDEVILSLNKIYFEDYINTIFGETRDFKIERLDEVKQWFNTLNSLNVGVDIRESKVNDVLTKLTVTFSSEVNGRDSDMTEHAFNKAATDYMGGITGISLLAVKNADVTDFWANKTRSVTFNFISKDTRATSSLGSAITDTNLNGIDSVFENNNLTFTTADLQN